MKDKALDKTQYKPSEHDQLNVYIKNYMEADPKAVNDEERAKLMSDLAALKQAELKVQKEAAKAEQTRTLSIKEESGSSIEGNQSDEGRAINTQSMKDMFDKMVEIDSDPNSKRAQEYYKRLEDMERKNPNKKKSSIIIKTMRKGKTVRQDSYSDGAFIGQKLTLEEKEFQKKYIDYKAVQFPEVNPIEMVVKGQGKSIKIANFRYPALTSTRKGVIHFNNGYGDYCARYGFLAEQFAKAGYDFVCMDPRGFGHSDGKRAFIESEKILLED